MQTILNYILDPNALPPELEGNELLQSGQLASYLNHNLIRQPYAYWQIYRIYEIGMLYTDAIFPTGWLLSIIYNVTPGATTYEFVREFAVRYRFTSTSAIAAR